MKISETPYSKKIVSRKIDDNTFELVELFDLSHPNCPVVLIGGAMDVLGEPSEELKVIE